MIVTFSYPLPDELYVEGVSGGVTGTYTYDGPETFDVHVDMSGSIIDIDVNNDPEMGPNFRKTIDASTNVEVAYMLAHYFIDDYVYEYETEDVVMDNGDIYKKILNPDLKDAYEARFNFEKNDWELNQIIKSQDNPLADRAKQIKSYIQKYSEKYSFGESVDIAIENYISQLDDFIADNPPIKTWKYTNFSFNAVPKIPAIITIEIAKLPSDIEV